MHRTRTHGMTRGIGTSEVVKCCRARRGRRRCGGGIVVYFVDERCLADDVAKKPIFAAWGFRQFAGLVDLESASKTVGCQPVDFVGFELHRKRARQVFLKADEKYCLIAEGGLITL